MAKRPIFEEVAEGAQKAPAPRVTIERPAGARRAIRAWLIVLFALVAVMIAVGGLTRLTGSGLSITDWRPVTGAIPPMSAADWEREFEAYRQIDQYRLLNEGMSLDEFQFIYWWEWGHRQLGRLIGLVWAVGFLWFWLRGQIPPGWTGRLLAAGRAWRAAGGDRLVDGRLGADGGDGGGRLVPAGGASGAGLRDPGPACLVHVCCWAGRRPRFCKRGARARAGRSGCPRGSCISPSCRSCWARWWPGSTPGAAYTDWPLMAGGIFPPGMFDLEPVWRNFFENNGTVQFIHRKAGYLLAIFALVVWLRGRRSQLCLGARGVSRDGRAHGRAGGAGHRDRDVRRALAAGHAHQILAVVLWVAILRARFLAGYPEGAPSGARG
jgi:heme a synthase